MILVLNGWILGAENRRSHPSATRLASRRPFAALKFRFSPIDIHNIVVLPLEATLTVKCRCLWLLICYTALRSFTNARPALITKQAFPSLHPALRHSGFAPARYLGRNAQPAVPQISTERRGTSRRCSQRLQVSVPVHSSTVLLGMDNAVNLCIPPIHRRRDLRAPVLPKAHHHRPTIALRHPRLCHCVHNIETPQHNTVL